MLGLMLALGCAVAGTASASDATPASTERLQALDDQILARLNATRAAHGLRPLLVSGQLENAAVAHSRDLLQAGVFQHDSPDGTSFVQRLKRFYSPSGYSSWTAGENILYNTGDIDAETAIQAWLDSPPHRQNMLDPGWREVGIGSVHASTAGGTFGGGPAWVITMDFGARTGAAKVVASPKRVTTKNAKRPAKPKPKPKPVAQSPSSGAPFTPPVASTPGPAEDALGAAAFGHRPDESEDDPPAGDQLAPLPPPTEDPPQAETPPPPPEP
jgi:uncharacterized protein YkwD